MRRPLLAALGGLLAGACSPVALLNAVAPRKGIEENRGLAYGPGTHDRLDLYAPRGAEGAPLVVFFYGGGWEDGDRAMYRFLGASLAAAGIVCVIPDYRVFPEVRFPTFVEDGARAVAWARAQGAAHGADPDRMLLMGHSAGAHIAAMLALDARFLAAEGLSPRMLRGMIGLAGPYDFLPLTSETLKEIFGPESTLSQSQPVNFVTPAAPPMLLATGDQDTTVLPRNTDRLAARLAAAEVPVRRIIYERIGHREIMGAMAGALGFLAPVRRDVLAFIAERTA